MAAVSSETESYTVTDVAQWLRSHQTLDKEQLQMDNEALAWFKISTGIQDVNELIDHICAVQAKAFAVFPYPCIARFNFTKLKISRLPPYRRVLDLGKTRPGAILLDLACCFGNDARRAVYDGYPAQNVICSDLRQEFWDLGHELFRDKNTFNVPFIAGDAFDSDFLSATADSAHPVPTLNHVKTLTELKGSVSVIHASSFFHLFDQERQIKLAHLVGSLVSREPGSIIFGVHAGALTAGAIQRGSVVRWLDGPESWTALWDTVLGEGKCKVETTLVPRDRPAVVATLSGKEVSHNLQWCVTIL